MSSVYKAVCAAINRNYHSDEDELEPSDVRDQCCLCFESIAANAQAVQVDDLVIYDSSCGQRSEEMAAILLAVLGNLYSDNIDIFKMVCEPCSKAAMSSYKFIQQCRENMSHFTAAVDNVVECFENLAEDVDNFETMYVHINTNDQTIQQVYDSKKIFSKETGLQRLHYLLSAKSNTAKTENSDKVNNENKRRERDSSTIFIKTYELMADPDSKIYQCKMCMKVCPTSGSLRLHFFSSHFKKEFQCTMCPKSFGTAGLLHTHENESHSSYTCEKCGKKMLNRTSTIKRHLLSHNTKQGRTCHRCGRSYKKMNDFNRHLQQDTCEMPSRVPGDYVCSHCGKHCHFKHQLAAHIRYEHGNAEGHVCKWCGRKCYSQSALKTHILKHTGEKNFICTVCGGKFVTRQSLVNHMRLHTGERPYPCEYCDQSFLSASRRKEHVERHHTDAVFECDLCDAKYSARRSLVKHKKCHFTTES